MMSTITQMEMPVNTSSPPNNHTNSLMTSQINGMANVSISAIKNRYATNFNISPIIVCIKG